jgi:hypothetical protein
MSTADGSIMVTPKDRPLKMNGYLPQSERVIVQSRQEGALEEIVSFKEQAMRNSRRIGGLECVRISRRSKVTELYNLRLTPFTSYSCIMAFDASTPIAKIKFDRAILLLVVRFYSQLTWPAETASTDEILSL